MHVAITAERVKWRWSYTITDIQLVGKRTLTFLKCITHFFTPYLILIKVRNQEKI
jgi:hypothetical protein